MITVEDYEQAASRFVAALETLGPSVESVMLYGSLGRCNVQPGSSDLLDAEIIVSAQMLEDEPSHRRLTELIVTETRKLQPLNTPELHPPGYNGDDELPLIWSSAAAGFVDPRTCRLAWGRDARNEIRNAVTGQDARGAFFAMRRRLMDWTSRVLADENLSRDEYIDAIQTCAFWFYKFFADYAVNELGEPAHETERWQVLAARLSGFDFERAQRLEASFREIWHTSREEIDPDRACSIVNDCFEIIEEIHDLLVQKLCPDDAQGGSNG